MSATTKDHAGHTPPIEAEHPQPTHSRRGRSAKSGRGGGKGQGSPHRHEDVEKLALHHEKDTKNQSKKLAELTGIVEQLFMDLPDDKKNNKSFEGLKKHVERKEKDAEEATKRDEDDRLQALVYMHMYGLTPRMNRDICKNGRKRDAANAAEQAKEAEAEEATKLPTGVVETSDDAVLHSRLVDHSSPNP